MYELIGLSGHVLHQNLMGYSTSDNCETSDMLLLNTAQSLKIVHPLPGLPNSLRLCTCAEQPFNIAVASCTADRVISYAVGELKNNKRDIGHHVCLSHLLQTRFILQRNVSDKVAAISLLERALEIADQACSIGMIGWEEYGMSSPLDRVAERSIDILSNHAGFLAQSGDWEAASGICMILLLKCERRFPLYHPHAIATLLDLAASLSCTLRNADCRLNKRITGLIERATYRVSTYLNEQARMCSSTGHLEKNDETDGANNMNAEEPHPDNTLGLKYLRAFVSKMLALLKRPMVRALGSLHPTVLFFNTYIADSLAILASYSASREVRDQFQDDEEKKSLWSVAGDHYRIALKGWIKLYGRGVSCVPATACGLARCLWELGKGGEAFVLLSRVIGFNGQAVLRPLNPSRLRTREDCETTWSDAEPSIAHFDVAYEESLSFSLWWMSVYFSHSFTRHHSADERLRAQILILLGASAEHLLNSLAQMNQDSTMVHDEARQKCEATLRVVENEAWRISSLDLGLE